MTLAGVTDVQQLTSMVMNNIGLSPGSQHLVLLYEDPGAREPLFSRSVGLRRHSGALLLLLTMVCRTARALFLLGMAVPLRRDNAQQQTSKSSWRSLNWLSFHLSMQRSSSCPSWRRVFHRWRECAAADTVVCIQCDTRAYMYPHGMSSMDGHGAGDIADAVAKAHARNLVFEHHVKA